MKKAKISLLIVSAGFLCVLVGIFIGRNASDNYITLQSAVENTYNDTREDSLQHTEAAENTEPGKININNAPLSQLIQLPGIGDTLAQRIIDYRSENGAFTSIEDITCVSGIGEHRFEQIRDYITTGG